MKYMIFVLACAGLFFGCVSSQDILTLDDNFIIMEQRISNLEKKSAQSARSVQFESLKSRMDNSVKTREVKEQNLRNRIAAIRVILNKLTDEIQIIRGKLEETEYFMKQKIKPFEKVDQKREEQITKMEEILTSQRNRIRGIEQYLNIESDLYDAKSKSDSEKNPKRKEKKKLSENEMYALAKQALDQGDFETAREGFLEIIKKYPGSGWVDNAQFWIGDAYYREKWYEKAILEYQKVIENYPKGNKVPASLLKQGFAFFNIGDKANARLILKELIKKYPKSNETKIAIKKLKEFK